MSAANLINPTSVVAPSITNQYASGGSGPSPVGNGTPIKVLPSQTFTTNTTGTPTPLTGSSITITQPGYYAYCVNYKIDPNGGSGMAYIIPILNTLTPLVEYQNDTYIGNVVQSRHTFYTIIQQPLNIGDTISLSHAEGAGLAPAINGVVWVSWVYLGNSTF
jgi:hypothetical protein